MTLSNYVNYTQLMLKNEHLVMISNHDQLLEKENVSVKENACVIILLTNKFM